MTHTKALWASCGLNGAFTVGRIPCTSACEKLPYASAKVMHITSHGSFRLQQLDDPYNDMNEVMTG